MRNVSGFKTLNTARKSIFLATTAIVAASAFFTPGQAQAVDDYADWDNVNITKGDAAVVDTGKGTTTVEQHSMRAVGEAQELHIGTMGDVTINQTSKDALFVGRVIGNHSDPTQILGKLSADGRVMIIDRNGVFFGEGSRVDAAGIAVSTGDVSDDQIMSGSEKLTFENFGDGEIVIKGNINVNEAGLAAFVAPTVKNSGVISAKLGNVVMASGEEVTLDMYGDGLVEVAVTGDLKESLIENKGTIDAQGGRVQLSTSTAKGVVDTVVNNEGVINASGIEIDGDKIILSGALDTLGAEGGEISVTGNDINITETGTISNKGEASDTYVYGNDKTTFKGKLAGGKNSTNEISGRALELGGEIELGQGSSVSFDPVTLDVGAAEAATFVSALNNNGVTVNVEAQDQINVNADINSSAQATNSTLNFKDEDANNNLQVDLNAKIKLGASQTLKGEATTVNVNGSAASIQNGVDIAKSGANVNVAAGTYNESVKVAKALTLSGANAGTHGNEMRLVESTIAPTAGTPGVLVTADNVTVDGFEIIGGNAGIHVKGGNSATLKNNYIHDQYDVKGEGNSPGGLATGDGIYVENSDGTKVKDNRIEDYNDDGVHAYKVSNLKVTGNVISDNGDGDQGIAVSNGSGKIDVSYNTVTNARRDGIQLSDTNATSTVRGNIVNGSANAGIGLVNITGGTTVVDDNQIDGGVAGIDLNNTKNVLIGDEDGVANSGNTISNAQNGVRVKNSNFLTIQDNTITGANNGVHFTDGINGKRTFVYDNDITAKNVGINVQGDISNGSIVNLGAQNLGNTIVAGNDGIRVAGAVTGSRLRVTGSTINGGNDGVEIGSIGEDGLVAIWYNDAIRGSAASGIRVNGINAVTPGSGLSVVGNLLVEGVAGDGIIIRDVNNANIAIVDNDLIKGQLQGISFAGTVNNANVLIGDDGLDGTASVVEAVQFDGIHFDMDVTNSNITVGDGTLSTQTVAATTTYNVTAKDGVTINSGNDAVGFDEKIDNSTLTFLENKINAGDNGFEFFGPVTNSDFTFRANTIDAANDGIDFDNTVSNTSVEIGSDATYAGNTITSVQSGIEFGKPSVPTAFVDGVKITVNGNTVSSQGNAFTLDGAASNTNVTIVENDLVGQERGISASGGDLQNVHFEIADNTRIDGVNRDGILIQDLVYGGTTANVTGNTDISGGDDGVDFRNVEGGQVNNNTIHDAVNNGVQLNGSKNIIVADNTIENNNTGLLLIDTDNINVQNNTIANNLLYGLHADGTGNGGVTLEGNVFLDNPTGARFESGQIDVSNTANPNIFRVTGAYNPKVSPLVGMQFDGAPTLLTIVNETLGTTIFDGYGSRPVGSAYYVRFEDGAILDPVTLLPILIDGDFASWDGVVPNIVPGFSTSVERQNIEDRLFDADDAVVDGRGQIFVGRFVPPGPNPNPDPTTNTIDVQFEDFFREYIIPDSESNRASLRVLGLPPISLAALNTGNNTPVALNNLAPAGGATNPEALANIAPAAGGETAETAGNEAAVADIEPEAGTTQDQSATCWGDVLNSLDNGSVTYSFGGTFEDSIAAETECQNQEEI